MRFQFRPLDAWPGPTTPDRRPAQFRADWNATVKLLGRETELLGADLVVIEVDAPAGQIRNDGMLYPRATVSSPMVRVSFASRHGPLRYGADRYDDWRDNVRAIALSLRAVDRYGVSSRGEQYRGWTAITAGSTSPAAPAMSIDEAARTLAAYVAGADPVRLPGDRAAITSAFRAAARATHDTDPAAFSRVLTARDALYAALTTAATTT